MILDWLGRAFQVAGRLRPGPAGDDRSRFGAELRRLDRRA